MKPTITCKNCGEKMSLDEALLNEIREAARKELGQSYQQQLKELEAKITREAEAKYQEQIKEAEARAAERASKRLEDQLKILREETEEEKKYNRELRQQLQELTRQLREANKAREDAELNMQKKLAEEEKKIRDEAEKAAIEKARLDLAERDKTINDLKKALEDAQRKAAQGSQQLQGEVLELDLEDALRREFIYDDIQPVEKGANGADVKQTVKTQRGTSCGIILWEIKRTKSWSDTWIQKLKADMRAEGAHCPAIITEAMPKEAHSDIHQYQGVWVCKPGMAIVLAKLLREGLLAAARERAIAQHRGTAADALYAFITSHEFAHHIEAQLETYRDMREQIDRERKAYEKIWKQREAQLEMLTTGLAAVYGSLEGRVGHAKMPVVKGLELLESGELNNNYEGQEKEK